MKKFIIIFLCIANSYLLCMDPIDQWEQAFDAVRAPVSNSFVQSYVDQPVPEMTAAVAAYYAQMGDEQTQLAALINASQLDAQPAQGQLEKPKTPVLQAPVAQQVSQQPMPAAASSVAQDQTQRKPRSKAALEAAIRIIMNKSDSEDESEESSEEEMDDDLDDKDYNDVQERRSQNKKRNRGKRKGIPTKAQDKLKAKVDSKSIKQNGKALKAELIELAKSDERHHCTVAGCKLSFGKASMMKKHIGADHIETLADLHKPKKSVRKKSSPKKVIDKPIPCTVEGCERTFSQTQTMQRHIRTFHDKSNPIATCKPCNHDFFQTSHYEAHLNCDIEFDCDNCGKSVHHSKYESHIGSHKKID